MSAGQCERRSVAHCARAYCRCPTVRTYTLLEPSVAGIRRHKPHFSSRRLNHTSGSGNKTILPLDTHPTYTRTVADRPTARMYAAYILAATHEDRSTPNAGYLRSLPFDRKMVSTIDAARAMSGDAKKTGPIARRRGSLHARGEGAGWDGGGACGRMSSCIGRQMVSTGWRRATRITAIDPPRSSSAMRTVEILTLTHQLFQDFPKKVTYNFISKYVLAHTL